MHLPIPIDLRKKLECPFCHRLSPVCEERCQHCEQRIPEDFRERERLRLKEQRKRQVRQAAVLMPLLLIVLTMVLQCAPMAGNEDSDLLITASHQSDGYFFAALSATGPRLTSVRSDSRQTNVNG